LSEIKKLIVVFHYAEKIKTNLILTVSLLEVLSDMEDFEVVGAEKILNVYLNALIGEVNIAASASGVHDFQIVKDKLMEVIEQIKGRNYANALKIISEAVSMTTTNAHQAAETLGEKGLI
jgi:aromatic ring hydroxylase